MGEEAEDVPFSPGAPQPKSAQNGAGHEASVPVDGAARNSGPAADTSKAKHLDFLFRSRSKPPEPAEPFVPQWPQRSARDVLNGPPVEPAPRPAKAEKPLVSENLQANGTHAPSAPVQEPRSAILKSGVVDGMAYTLYADGSIEAQLPQGTVRFESITELRSHIENNS
jgi:hypothetical protein